MPDQFMHKIWEEGAVEAGSLYQPKPPVGRFPQGSTVFHQSGWVPGSLNEVEPVQLTTDDCERLDTAAFWERLQGDILVGQLGAQWILSHMPRGMWREFTLLFCLGDIWVDQDPEDGNWYTCIRRNKRVWEMRHRSRVRSNRFTPNEAASIGYLRQRK